MDSFFKAAVCDLDKLLDDFELNPEEHDCKSVFLKTSPYPFSSLGPQCATSEVSTVPKSLPDLNSLHYGSATSCSDITTSHDRSTDDREAKGQPLTGVDLLSSLDQRTAKSSAPPCPDRALKPVCDLVNDTSSAILTRASSHDAFNELDMVEKQMEEEALLVDFDSPVVTVCGEEVGDASLGAVCSDTKEEQPSALRDQLLDLDSDEQVSGYTASFSLLDVILPAAVERSCELTDVSQSPKTTEPAEIVEKDHQEVVRLNQLVDNTIAHCDQDDALPADNTKDTATSSMNDEHNSQESLDRNEAESSAGSKSESTDGNPVGLSCLPIAMSMCRAVVNPEAAEVEFGQCDEVKIHESTEAEFLPTLEAKDNGSSLQQHVNSETSQSQQIAEGRKSPEGQHVCLGSPSVHSADLAFSERSEPSPVDPPNNSKPIPVDPPNSSEPIPVDPPDFGFECLPESDQAEMLVTDEELDAFLQSHTEAEQSKGVSYCFKSGECRRAEFRLTESDGYLEDRLVEEELRSSGHSTQEELEGLASPESDRMICVSAKGTFNPGAEASQESCNKFHLEPDLSSRASHSLNSNSFQSEHSGSPEQKHPYGGARPKQLHCQTSRSPPAGEVGEEPAQTLGAFSQGPSSTEDDQISPTSPDSTEDLSKVTDSAPIYAAQESQDNIVAYDELSEPPVYPGEAHREDVRSGDGEKEKVEDLGIRQPAWVPDSDAPNCMKCSQRFTFTKRRHHCRACGKVYCAICCNRRCKLKYLEKEARVCVVCFDAIHRAQALERMMSPTGPSPNPNVPSEYCNTIPPLQQAHAAGTLNSPPPTVMVPVSVLKQPSSDSCPREQKRVWFADGILPNGEVADTSKLSVMSHRSPQEFSGVTPDPPNPDSAGPEMGVGGLSDPESCGNNKVVRPPVSGPWDYVLLSGLGSSVSRIPSLLPENEEQLPPLLITTGEDEAGDIIVEENPAPCQIQHLLQEGGPRPLTFVLNVNLLVNVKLVTYCSRQCWFFGSNGLRALGQKELVFLLECLPEEKTLPNDLFTFCLGVYQDAQKGRFLEELDNVTFTSSFLGSKDHAGMLFFSPTCQPLDDITLPPQPFLIGLLIHKLEVPWAKVFPHRLLLRLGAEYDVYPTTLISVRFRNSVYQETGHTIMNLLADLRNYQYSLSTVEGLRIHMEMGHSYIDIPKSSFNEMLKVVNVPNEHVISIGASFSSEADSHLVCFQNEEGNYQTRSNSKPGQTRTVTGASFVVFNGALKASSGLIAKSSVIEDGLMVQIPPETMESLRTALREQTDFHIPCGKNDAGELREDVTVRWVDWSAPVNTGRTSGVDGRPLDGVHSVRILQDTEFVSDGCSIRCTEVFYQPKTPECSLSSVLASCGVFQKEIALAACSALTPHLAVLTSSGINSLSLRVSTHADMVEYQAGCGGRLLPQRYMNELDSSLIPVIHGGSASVPQTAMDTEFLLYITHTI